MRTLDLNQMENISGGGCKLSGEHLVAALSLYSAIFFAAGPIGWGMAALAVAGAYYTSTDCAVK